MSSFARALALIAAPAAVPLAGLGLAPLANAQTPQPMDPCGPGTSSIIWDGVKNADPVNKSINCLAVWPNGSVARLGRARRRQVRRRQESTGRPD